MTTSPSLPTPPPPAAPRPGDVVDGVTVRPVPRGDLLRTRVTGVLLTGRDAPRDPSVEAFVAYTRQAGLDTAGLWAGFEGGGVGEGAERPVTAAVAMESPGRTAMVLVSPVRTPRYVHACAACIAATIDALPPGKVGLAQCLLELDQLYEQAALASAGFTTLARLMYMQRDLGADQVDPDAGDRALPGVSMPDGDMQLLRWRDDRRDLFARAVLDSYEDTLDCPGLVGTRDIDDILAGHRGTGVFNPGLWTVALMGETPVGVLMLAQLPQRDAVELVYLGVSKAARGRGLGQQLLRHGVAQARQHHARSVLLAVDEQNTPAVDLYRDTGFRPQARRTALVRFLPV